MMSSEISRKKARLSNEAAASRPPTMSQALKSSRPPLSAEARRKRQQAIAAALGEVPLSRNAPSPSAVADSSSSATISGPVAESRDSLFNATNLPPVASSSHSVIPEVRRREIDATLNVSSEVDGATSAPSQGPSSQPQVTAAETSSALTTRKRGSEALDESVMPTGTLSTLALLSELVPDDDDFVPDLDTSDFGMVHDGDAVPGPSSPSGSQLSSSTNNMLSTFAHPPFPHDGPIGFISPRTKRPVEASQKALSEAKEIVTNVFSGSQSASPIRRPQLPFKTPFMPAKSVDSGSPLKNGYGPTSAYQPSPLNPNRIAPKSFPPIQAPVSTPIRPPFPHLSSQLPSRSSTPVGFSTPPRLSGMSGRRSAQPASKGFVTPFKPGYSPSERGRQETPSRHAATSKAPTRLPSALAATIVPPLRDKGKRRADPPPNSCFDINPPEHRMSLRDFGLAPGKYRLAEVERLGVPSDIPQINPANAVYYSFYAPGAAGDEPTMLGSTTAFEYLRRRGCSLATQEWVGNHWSLILWKKASTICCKPTIVLETWKFESICHDLMYRYERELNRGQRPIVRLIQERDAPASYPMVLCVSNIQWSEEVMTQDGEVILPHPELELTDGWYRIRAIVDEALARAARRQKIRLGTKIAISGAKLDAHGEPNEVLKSYDSSCLKIFGNSTTLARWDTKLGKQPPKIVIATLRSLTPDGGPVVLLDVVVEKLFPVGYLETTEDGERLPPVNDTEERQAQAKWENQRQNEETKLRSEYERRWFALEGIAERAARVANGWTPGPDDPEPHSLDDLFESLESSVDFGMFYKGLTLSSHESGWFAHYIRQRVAEQRERAAETMASELDSIISPRNVRNFRVIRVHDARTARRPTLRTAQITVWDVLSLGEGFFAEGKRYLVSNLIPSQASAWPALPEEGEVFLTSRYDSRWKRIGLSDAL